MKNMITLWMPLLFLINVDFLFAADIKETSSALIENSKPRYAANMPPGLLKKGKMPPGLQGKTPPGWKKGQKRGWTRVWNAENKKWQWIQVKGKSVNKGKQKAINPGRRLR